MFGWLSNRLRRGLTNRSYQQICREVGSQGGGSAFFAVAIAAAVYPDAQYGSAEWDMFAGMLAKKPILDTRTATQITEAWLDRHEMPWHVCVSRLYGCEPMELMSPQTRTPAAAVEGNSGTTSDVARQLQAEINKNVAIAETRMATLEHVLRQPFESDLDRERIVELSTRALRWAYIALAGSRHASIFADAFYCYSHLMNADLLYHSGTDAVALARNHDEAYGRVKEADAVLVSPTGRAAIRESGEFFASLDEDDPLRTITNWMSLVLNGRFLNYVDPVKLPKLVMECAILCADLEFEATGGKLKEGKIVNDRAELRATVMSVCDQVKPLLDGGQLVFKDGKLVPTGL